MQPQPKPNSKAKPATLVGVVGLACASLLYVAIPREESGRKVEAKIEASTGKVEIRHISGKQYLRSYLDIVGVGTACDGLTRDEFGRPIRLGMRFTEAQCAAMLERALVAHAQGVMALTPGLALALEGRPGAYPQLAGARFAAVSLAYNVGLGNYAKSTVRVRFNQHRYIEGCAALLAWDKAGGRVNNGLKGRRERERFTCLTGRLPK